MENLSITPIGLVQAAGNSFAIQLKAAYAPGLEGLGGFSHLQMLWWSSELDSPEARSVLTVPKPYVKGPESLGIFATRSPLRPNPICLTVARVLGVDAAAGRVELAWTDAHHGTPVLDLKPYTPSSDLAESFTPPAWCAHWPKSLEAGAAFDWEKEFNF